MALPILCKYNSHTKKNTEIGKNISIYNTYIYMYNLFI